MIDNSSDWERKRLYWLSGFSFDLDDASSDEVENLLKELTVMKRVGKHVNIISLLGCCIKGGKTNNKQTLSFLDECKSQLFSLSSGQVMLIVEYAKYGNLRDYLRRKRPSGHVLSSSFEQDDDYESSYKQDDNDELVRALTTIDLIVFCLQTACGMNYLHSKKVKANLYSEFVFHFLIESIE